MRELSLYNEEEADIIVKAVMLLHDKKLLVIDEGSTPMSLIIIKDADGQIKQVTNTDAITREELIETVEDMRRGLQDAENALAEYDRLAGTGTSDTAQTEVTPVPAGLVEESQPVVAEPTPQPEQQDPTPVPVSIN